MYYATNLDWGSQAMSILRLRKDIEAIRASAQSGDLSQVVERAEHALNMLDGVRLLTTTEAAELLDMRSVNTLKLLIRRLGVPYQMHGNRMMIPLAELERLQHDEHVRSIRASDRAHEAIEELGQSSEMSAEELEDLAQGRPGQLAWDSSQKD